MKQRCYDPNCSSYSEYGGRGIRVCDEWRDDFTAFIRDMGPRPPHCESIDRRDTNGNYEPGNCRWATRIEQIRNRRNTVFLTFGAETRPMAEWAEIRGIPYKTLRDRINDGWSPEMALTVPVDPSKVEAALKGLKRPT
jgi:hypothetical protein